MIPPGLSGLIRRKSSMGRASAKSRLATSGEELGAQLLQSVREMKAGLRGRAPLGSRLAARFDGLGLTQDLPELPAEQARPADFTGKKGSNET